MSKLDDNLDAKLKEYGKGVENWHLELRHPSSLHMLKVLAPNPNLPADLYDISESFWDLGINLLLTLQDGPELTAGLRKLLEAKDCFVRAQLDRTPVDYRDR